MLNKLYEILEDDPIDKDALITLIPIFKELEEVEFYHPAHCYNILEHSIKSAELVDETFLKVALLFHDIGKLNKQQIVLNKKDESKPITKFNGHELESVRITKDILTNHMNEEELEYLLNLIKYHDTPLITTNEETLDDFVELYGNKFVSDLLKIQRADMRTHSKDYYEKVIKARLDHVEHVYQKKLLGGLNGKQRTI